MATRKDIIIQNYLKFQKELQGERFDYSIFPSLEDVDLVDLMVLFNYTFNNSNPIAQLLDELMKINSIECSKEVRQICINFIQWFLDFQKSN